MQERKGRPTLKHVAEHSGVSLISASRVMRDAPNISQTLRGKVLASAAALGYTPNRIAGSLRGQTSGLIAVIVPSMSNNVFANIVDGIDDSLSQTQYGTVLGMSHYDEAREEAIVRDLLSWNPAGIIIAGLEHSEAARVMLAEHESPVIEVMDSDGTPIDMCVGTSQEDAGRMMADHFVEQGYRRIGYIGAWGERPVRSRKRRVAFEDSLAQHGIALSARQIEDASSSVKVGSAACAQLLAENPDLEAIFFANDDLALGALFYCMGAGINVPGDIALAGFNGLDMCDVITPKLTTIHTPRMEIGQVAGQMLIDRLAGKVPAESHVNLPISLVVGQTT